MTPTLNMDRRKLTKQNIKREEALSDYKWKIGIHPGNESVLHLFILFAITYRTIKPFRSS